MTIIKVLAGILQIIQENRKLIRNLVIYFRKYTEVKFRKISKNYWTCINYKIIQHNL